MASRQRLTPITRSVARTETASALDRLLYCDMVFAKKPLQAFLTQPSCEPLLAEAIHIDVHNAAHVVVQRRVRSNVKVAGIARCKKGGCRNTSSSVIIANWAGGRPFVFFIRRHSLNNDTTLARRRGATAVAFAGSIKGDVKKKHSSPHQRGFFLASSPCIFVRLPFAVAWFSSSSTRDPSSFTLRSFRPGLRPSQAAWCQPWFYLRLVAYGFVGLSEGAYGAR